VSVLRRVGSAGVGISSDTDSYLSWTLLRHLPPTPLQSNVTSR